MSPSQWSQVAFRPGHSWGTLRLPWPPPWGALAFFWLLPGAFAMLSIPESLLLSDLCDSHVKGDVEARKAVVLPGSRLARPWTEGTSAGACDSSPGLLPGTCGPVPLFVWSPGEIRVSAHVSQVTVVTGKRCGLDRLTNQALCLGTGQEDRVHSWFSLEVIIKGTFKDSSWCLFIHHQLLAPGYLLGSARYWDMERKARFILGGSLSSSAQVQVSCANLRARTEIGVACLQGEAPDLQSHCFL